MTWDGVILDEAEIDWDAETKKAKADFENAAMPDGSLLIEHNDGITETLHYDPIAEEFHVHRVEDVESVLDWCKASFNEGLVRKNCEFRHIGRYPITVVQAFAKKWGFDSWHECLKNKEMFWRLVEDRDLSGFRTLPGIYTRRA